MLCVYNHTIYVADVMSVTFSGSVRDDFAGSEDAPHDWSVQLVLPLAHVSRVVGNESMAGSYYVLSNEPRKVVLGQNELAIGIAAGGWHSGALMNCGKAGTL